MSLTNGLLAYYRLDGDTNDSSGNNRNNTHQIFGSYIIPKDNWLMSGALNDYIEMPGDTVFTDGVTISFWLKANDDNTGDYSIVSKGQTGYGFDLTLSRINPAFYSEYNGQLIPEQNDGSYTNTARYSNNTSDLDHPKIPIVKTNVLRNSHTKMKITLKGGNQGDKNIIVEDINTNYLLDNAFTKETLWKHIVFTASNISKKAKLFVNGIKVSEYTTTDNVLYSDQFITDKLRVGEINGLFSIDEVRIYNRELSDDNVIVGQKAKAEIEELYISDIYTGYTTPLWVDPPKITPESDTFIGEARISTICDDGIYKFCYTTDGSEPDYNSSYVNSRECIKLDSSCTLKIKKFITSTISSNTLSKVITVENVTDLSQALVSRCKFNGTLTSSIDYLGNSYGFGATNTSESYGEDKNNTPNKSLILSNTKQSYFYDFGYAGNIYYPLESSYYNTKFALSFWLKAPTCSQSDTSYVTIIGSEQYGSTLWNTDSINVAKIYKDGASKLVFHMAFEQIGLEQQNVTYTPNDIEVSGYTDNTWHHIVINFISNMIYVFIDKVCVGMTTYRDTERLKYSAHTFWLGWNNSRTSSPDYLDELRFYVRPLKMGVNDIELNTVAQSEIKMLYDLGVDSITLQIPYTNNNIFTFDESAIVDLVSPDNAPIYYTLDGSIPSISSSLYSAPITITNTTTIKAICIRLEDTNSPILTLNYTKSNLKLTESNIEKIQNFSSNNVVIEIEKNGEKSILYDFNYSGNLAFYIKQEYLENKHPLFNNINNRKINNNDCYLEIEVPFTKDNLKIFEVLDFDVNNYASQNVIKRDNSKVLVNIHPIYKGSDRYFDIELPQCDYVVDITNNLSFNSNKTIKITFYPRPVKLYLVNNFDNMELSNTTTGTLISGTYSYAIQYINRFSKGGLSEFKDVTSLDNSKNLIDIKLIPNSVEDIIIWRKKDNILQGYYILSKAEILNKQVIDDGSKTFKAFTGNMNIFNKDLYYYNLLKFGK